MNPWWLAVLPAVLAAITLLYFLKLKRREVLVASTFLWHQAIRDLRVNSPFQRLRMNLLLFLQLLIAALVVLALARPRAALGNLGGRDLVFVVDQSASMGATLKSGETRLERAKQDIRVLINDMSGGDKAILLSFDNKPHILESLTNDKRRLLNALAEIQPTEYSTALSETLDLAMKLSATDRQERNREVLIFSDGVCAELGPAQREEELNSPGLEASAGLEASLGLEVDVPSDVETRYIKVGDDAPNVGIANVDLRRTLDEDASLQLFVSLVNDTTKARTLGLDLTINGQLVESREINLAKRTTTSVIIDSESLRKGRLEVSLDVKDNLALDNKAYAMVREKAAIQVLLVSNGNRFLENALEKMPFAVTRTTLPEEFDATDADLARFDVILFDRVQIAFMPPSGCLFIDCLPPYQRLTWREEQSEPRIIDFDETHPVNSYLQYAELSPIKMRPLKLGDSDSMLVESDKGPLLSVIREEARESLVLSFDILQSRWPFQASFPIFLANSIHWLGGTSTLNKQLKTGEIAVLNVGANGGELRVKDPSGKTHSYQLEKGRRIANFEKTHRQGFYRAEVYVDGKLVRKQDFAVNLKSEVESRIYPREKLRFRGAKSTIKTLAKVEANNKEIWRWLAWTLLALFVIEWWVYNRRVYV